MKEGHRRYRSHPGHQRCLRRGEVLIPRILLSRGFERTGRTQQVAADTLLATGKGLLEEYYKS